jgi:DNA (cytosine-5)-methyltransferase 1
MTIRFGSVCSGIEAATVAWQVLGWEAAWYSEIENFPCQVLKHHYACVPNLGDMSLIPDRVLAGEIEAPRILVGGTPCQAFSLAGLRRGLLDHRGQLSLTYVKLANAIDSKRLARGQEPCIAVWENVRGVLSTAGNAFGHFLAALIGASEPLVPPDGGRWPHAGVAAGPQRAAAWRVLAAQHFGLPQRRSRVFLVASAGGSPERVAEILFESESEGWSLETGQEEAGERGRETIAGNARTSARGVNLPVVYDARGNGDGLTTNCLTGDHLNRISDYTPVVVDRRYSASAHAPGRTTEYTVRRLTPRECERLQGFPDDYTLVPVLKGSRIKRVTAAADSPRYKVLGNSMPVPVMRWIGKRIQQIHNGFTAFRQRRLSHR